jgi:hypothetical protein
MSSTFTVVLAALISAVPQSGPSPLCLQELPTWCCHQVAREWLIVNCGGEQCTGNASANLVIHYDRTYGSSGFSQEQWAVKQDGSTCVYNRVECIQGKCEILPEKITWHCHRVILSGTCPQ